MFAGFISDLDDLVRCNEGYLACRNCYDGHWIGDFVRESKRVLVEFDYFTVVRPGSNRVLHLVEFTSNDFAVIIEADVHSVAKLLFGL